jgi:hypothetical protein
VDPLKRLLDFLNEHQDDPEVAEWAEGLFERVQSEGRWAAVVARCLQEHNHGLSKEDLWFLGRALMDASGFTSEPPGPFGPLQ